MKTSPVYIVLSITELKKLLKEANKNSRMLYGKSNVGQCTITLNAEICHEFVSDAGKTQVSGIRPA
jgi:hypothetical protein